MQPVCYTTQTNYLNQYLTPQQLQFQQHKFIVHEQLRHKAYIPPTHRTVVTHSPMSVTRTISNTGVQLPMAHSHTVLHPVPQPVMRQFIQQPNMVITTSSPSLPSPIIQLPPPIFQPTQTVVHNQIIPQTQTIVQQQFPQQLPPFIPPPVVKHETVTILELRKEKDPPYLSMSCEGNRTTVDPVKGKFTEYKIIIETNIEEYMVEKTQWKRYSDFEELHQIITQSYRHIVLPPMPSKHYFTQFDETVIRDRERAFDKMLNILCTDHSNTALINFIQKDA